MVRSHITIAAPAAVDWRELARRTGDGLDVSLLWSATVDRVKVVVVDLRLDLEFQLDIAGSQALDAFHHPYSFLPHSTGRWPPGYEDEAAA